MTPMIKWNFSSGYIVSRLFFSASTPLLLCAPSIRKNGSLLTSSMRPIHCVRSIPSRIAYCKAFRSGTFFFPAKYFSKNNSAASIAATAFSYWCTPSIFIVTALYPAYEKHCFPSFCGRILISSKFTTFIVLISARSAALFNTSIASFSWLSNTSAVPCLIIPAFSAAILASVSPRIAIWSKPIFAMTVTSGTPQAFVESYVPPSPVSKITTSHFCSLK